MATGLRRDAAAALVGGAPGVVLSMERVSAARAEAVAASAHLVQADAGGGASPTAAVYLGGGDSGILFRRNRFADGVLRIWRLAGVHHLDRARYRSGGGT